MALGTALVDRARLISKQSTGRKVDGKTQAGDVTGPWFRARLELPEGQEGDSNVTGRRRTVVRPSLMCGARDSEGNTISFGSHDRLDVDSPQLGRATFEVAGEPKPMRKRRTVIGWEVTLARVEEHSGAGAL